MPTPPPVSPTETSTPIPTETFTPVPPPLTPTGAKTPNCKNVAGEDLNVRAGPGMEYDPPLGVLSPGQVAVVIGKNAPYATWWKIRSGELEGWVSARFCVGDFDPNQVPIIYVPPPTPCRVQVPDLTQRKINEAEEQARQAQLVPIRDPRCMSEGNYDLGDVVTGQSLAPGSSVPCGSKILLTYIKEGDICTPTPTPCDISSSCMEYGGEIYTVRPGDWIAQLCRGRGYYGPVLDICVNWTILHSCISNPDKLQPGQQICLPPPPESARTPIPNATSTTILSPTPTGTSTP
jgi:uncharacterized protein YraI